MPASRHLLLSLAAALAFTAAACGGSGSAASPSAVTGAPGSSASPAATASTAGASAAATTDAGATVATDAPISCAAPATATVSETEGPFYKAGAAESANLVTDGMAGTRLTLTGYVVSTDCTPIAVAKVEIWQADSAGSYDNAGYTLRGWITTDADGRFTILTIVPGEYPGRTEHIHVKVTPPGGATLTTQLYFPGTAGNDADVIYDPSLQLDITQAGDGLVGTCTFVLAA
jgi:protocatechuate 3,4-dioxygenase beta subunit